MAYVQPTDTILSTLTTQGRDLLARATLGQVSFHFSGYKVGRKGYQDGTTYPDGVSYALNPVKVVPPQEGSTDLIDAVYPLPTTTIAPFTTIERPAFNVVAPVARIPRTDCLYGLGEIGIWVHIDRAIAPATATYAAGSDYLFALAHFPLMSKTDKHVFVLRLVVAT